MERKKSADQAFTAEVSRVDSLLSKWGVLVGGLGDSRARRREISTALARHHPGLLTDRVMEQAMAEARTQSVRNAKAWLVGILGNPEERASYLPELARMANEAKAGDPAVTRDVKQDGPGDRKHDPHSREALAKEADASGRTVGELLHLKRRFAMFGYHCYDRTPIAQVAELQGMTVEDCRAQIDAECKIQTDMSLDEWQASRPGRKNKRDHSKEPRSPRRDEHISELDRRIEKDKEQ